jgi:hypothetical protein
MMPAAGRAAGAGSRRRRARGDRPRALYLDANGFGTQMVFVDTVLRGILRYRDGDLPPKPLRRSDRVNALFASLRPAFERLSYVADWREAIVQSPRLDVEVCNINNLVEFGKCLLRIGGYDLIIISHAATGNDMGVLSRAARWLQRRRGRLAVFIGNEYDLLDEKIAFLRRVRAEFICTQLPLAAAKYLYQECESGEVIEMPHALNPVRYHAEPGAKRETDVGFIGDIYWPFVGDRERTDLIEWFERHAAARGLRHDIRKERIAGDAWSAFLNRCKAIIGAESGTYYLNDRGRLLDQARAYNLFQNRAATFEEVYERFYRGRERGVSGKSISSRHFEPIGTRTCQILLEGHYNGILRPDEHYIAVRKDLSNIEEAIEKFRDETFRSRMVDQTYEYVMDQHTYAHRVERLLSVTA